MPGRKKRMIPAGLLAGISILLILNLFGVFDGLRSDADGHRADDASSSQSIGSSEEEPTEQMAIDPTDEPVEDPTTEPTESPTEEPTVESTRVPTEESTVEPTLEPTIAPTEVPTVAPTPEPQASIKWNIVEADSHQPINQAQAWLAFNAHEPVQLLWSDANGDIRFDFEELPNLGQNGRGYVSFQANGMERTEVWFAFDSVRKELVLIRNDGSAIEGSIPLHSPNWAKSNNPSSWHESQVWPSCNDVECATEIALTSGYFATGEIVACQPEILDAKFASQRYRAANGVTVVQPTNENPNIVDALWMDGEPGFEGWRCESGEETIFVVGGCGNIAVARP